MFLDEAVRGVSVNGPEQLAAGRFDLDSVGAVSLRQPSSKSHTEFVLEVSRGQTELAKVCHQESRAGINNFLVGFRRALQGQARLQRVFAGALVYRAPHQQAISVC